MDVLIAGAGPVGLMLAGELARRGVAHRLIDSRATPAPWCKALGVQSRTLEIFDILGVADEALARGVCLRAANTHFQGECIQRVEIDGKPLPGIPYAIALSLEQNVTEEILTKHLERHGGAVERGVDCLGIEQDEEGVTALLRSDKGEERIRCRYLVGCDGAHSVVRRGCGIGFEGDKYPDTFMLADVEVAWPLAPDESHFCVLSEDDWLVAIPILGRGRFRLSTRDADPPTAVGPTHGLLGEQEAPTLEQMQAVVDRLAPGATLSNPRWTSRYRISHRLATAYRHGRAFLAGDAAHIHAPTGGQGMNTGLQDAWNLGWKLAMVVRGEAKPGLLDTYDAERRPIAREVLRKTDEAMKSRQTTALFPAGRELLMRWGQLDLNYRGGPLSEDHLGGPLQAGDRVPDAPVTDADGGNPRRLADALRPGRFVLAGPVDLPGRERVQLRLGDDLRDLFGPADAVLLVRPDGYLGFASRDAAALRGYLDRLSLA